MTSCIGRTRFLLRLVSFALLASAFPITIIAGESGPAVVQLRKNDDGWELVRNGQPYFIRGAGGEGPPELLAELGGNSLRTWGTENLGERLDRAEALGLSLAVGIWLGHERHGFNYHDAQQVARQYETVREAILQYKDHPAVLLWGLGNEMEGYGKGDNAAIWSAVNDLARMAKRLDENHPTMTVIAEVGGDRVPSVHRLCPDIDIVGINSYAGARSVSERYRRAGGTKPFVLTEFGPPGPWEVEKNAWGAPLEPSSSEKAIHYRRSYRGVIERGAVEGAAGLFLGSYAFIWGHKQETTATWFGMLLPDGSRLGAADTMSALWTGRPLANRCPVIESLRLSGPGRLEPSATAVARLSARDPEDDALQVQWVLQADPLTLGMGGDAEDLPPTFPEAVIEATSEQAKIRMPAEGGGYRLYAYVRDGHGGAAVANVPLFCEARSKGSATSPAEDPAK